MRYHNPVIPGFHPDPSICRDEKGGYYLVTSSFEYVPAVPLFYSTDLVNWTCVGHCLDRENQIDLEGTPPSGGIFAPTIRKHKDTYYMITTNVTRGVFYVTSKNPHEGWSEPIFLKGVRGIDPSLTFTEDGVYLQIAIEGTKGISCIAQAEIDLDAGQLIGELVELSYGTGGRDVEAPHVYRKDGYFYLLCAEGGTREGHMVTVQRSREIWGPYEACELNPILTNRDKSNEELQAVGHADLIQDYQGNWWCVALAHRALHFKHVLGRETILLPATWEENEWPVIDSGYAKYEIQTDAILGKQNSNTRCVDDFGSEKLAPYWNKLRKFNDTNYQIDVQNRQLTLFGQSITLDEADAPIYLCRRQEHFEFSFTVDLDLNGEYQDSGLAIYMDPSHHMEICIQTEGEQQKCYVRKTVGEIKVNSSPFYLPKNRRKFRIKGNKKTYRFYYIENGHEIQMEQTLCAHLSTEVADSDYKGVYMGMYVQSAEDQLKVCNVVYEEAASELC